MTGGGWTIRALPGPGHARGLNDHGEVAGLTYRVTPYRWLEDPAYWNASGQLSALPLPQGYDEGRAHRINNDGDISGSVSAGNQTRAALWIRRGANEWEPVVVLDGGAIIGITDRRSDGTLLAAGHAARSTGGCCRPAGWTVAVGPPGSVTTIRTSLGDDWSAGEGHGINPAGEVAGFGWKGTFGADQPLLFPASGTAVRLPRPKNGSGKAFGITVDGWLAGYADDRAVVWRPSN